MVNKQLEKILSAKSPVAVNENHVKHTIVLAREEVSRHQPFRPMGLLSFCLAQVGFLAWPSWLLQALLLLSLCLSLDVLDTQNIYTFSYSAPVMLRAAAIITVLTVLPLLYRSQRYRMLEIEISARAAYSRLILARLLVAGSGNAVMLAGIWVFALLRTDMAIISALFCVLAPLLILTATLLFCLRRVSLTRLPYALYAVSAVLLLVSAGLGSQTAASVWYPLVAAVCALLLLFCLAQIKLLRSQGFWADVQFS